MTNYICINGNKTELTEEQLRQLGIELPKASPFARAKKRDTYYMIDHYGGVNPLKELDDGMDIKAFNIANYCTDKSLMEQRALHETLNRLLWRYSMEHDGDKIDWNDSTQRKWEIDFNFDTLSFEVYNYVCLKAYSTVYFHTKEIAFNAIEEIIKPFMAAHPDFKF